MSSKIYGFSYAGGNSEFFNELKGYLFLKGVELIPLEYSGHGTRRKEPLYSNFAQLAEDMSKQILQNLSEDEPYYIMGYSMGTIAVVETLKLLLERHERMPQAVILAAHEPKGRRELSDWSDDISEECVKEQVLRFGGVSPELVENRVFWRVYLPIYENDFRMIGEYDFENICLKVNIPALIMYSENDTPFGEIRKWNNYFMGENIFREYSGNHFFINEHLDEISEQIAKWVKR